jgi:hypothetical protein
MTLEGGACGAFGSENSDRLECGADPRAGDGGDEGVLGIVETELGRGPLEELLADWVGAAAVCLSLLLDAALDPDKTAQGVLTVVVTWVSPILISRSM